MNATERIASMKAALDEAGYLADESLATVVVLARMLNKAVLLEGDPGVGKTDLARAVAEALDTRLIRLQCYEGLESVHALYEWNYAKQLVRMRTLDERKVEEADLEALVFSEDCLIKRPLLEAIDASADKPPVLLIDEIDRADEPFEAFLLEILSDWQVTIPELGKLRAEHPPLTIVTSNRTREIHDALKRRCLYMWLDYPSFDREVSIIAKRVPGLSSHLARIVCGIAAELRELGLNKPPGVAESLDLAKALVGMEVDTVDDSTFEASMPLLIKSRDDLRLLAGNPRGQILERAQTKC